MLVKSLLIAIAFFITIKGYSQPKNATTIIVVGIDHKTVNNSILDQGYFIDKYEPELGTSVTSEKEFQNGVWYLKLKVRVKDSTAYISGDLKVMISPFGETSKSYEPVINRGMKGSPYKIAFSEMVKLALSFNKPISYK